ncbi:MAG: ABC transporter ATP-binding protein [Armatimonadota bacterium]|nr:ABC transporter ATP-binding protein [Armatimonadota bacterium]MDR7448101.1 ABC transporter ATP-binding protein [Armatimonadota bacterium]MDR7459695.1 ABC transporter ATP-binding protein [Armatimonadota bacterium]MDR7478287.1 ABC transporter ATP-binding protein [Armatimonadota bacterium]MDR7487270.1 ABC transporter ATP-binding protein [Armatimonadota bacterium]
MAEQPLLSVRNLKTYFYTDEGVVKAVDGLSYDLHRGETLGIVGESGSGKSVHALSIMRLIPQPPGKIVAGEILFEGRNLLSLSEEEMRRIRGNRIAMIFQEPMTSLNPVLTIGEQIAEAVMLHQRLPRKAAWDRAVEMLEKVRIPLARERVKDYPHQFSGGMRQRVMIAMALSCNPSILIADEPTTALDVTIQAQILELMQELQQEFHMAIILITHNLGVVAEMCDNVVVMYAGRPVEKANVLRTFQDPKHPYTWGLLHSIPKLHERKERLIPIEGQPPSLIDLPPGCPFAPRCPFAMEICVQEDPPEYLVGPEHTARCYLYSEHATEEDRRAAVEAGLAAATPRPVVQE